MAVVLDPRSQQILFTNPDMSGRFSGAALEHLQALGRKRKLICLAFAPKSAGTFFRSAIIYALGGQLVRLTHALGGRDGTPYLPTFVAYFAGGVTPRPLVGHIHMQGFAGNTNFLDAFGIKPILMLRNIPDMMASFLDMLEQDPSAADHGVNFHSPPGFRAWSRDARAEFLVDMLAPWYASYFGSWLDYHESNPDRLCVLHFSDMVRDPALAVRTACLHAGFAMPAERAAQAAVLALRDKAQLRFNKGVDGRGQRTFSSAQIDRIERLIDHYPVLSGWKEHLLHPTGGLADDTASHDPATLKTAANF